jgi:hypothetical protein
MGIQIVRDPDTTASHSEAAWKAFGQDSNNNLPVAKPTFARAFMLTKCTLMY